MGPFLIKHCMNYATVEFVLPKNLCHIHPIFCYNLLKHHLPPDALHSSLLAPPLLMVVGGGGQLHHEAEEILDSKVTCNKL